MFSLVEVSLAQAAAPFPFHWTLKGNMPCHSESLFFYAEAGGIVLKLFSSTQQSVCLTINKACRAKLFLCVSDIVIGCCSVIFFKQYYDKVPLKSIGERKKQCLFCKINGIMCSLEVVLLFIEWE
jgi:hypothetical protein